MIKQNKRSIIISSLITLVPAILMKSWMPLMITFVHLVCILATCLDKRNESQSPKVFRLVLWICPILAVYILGLEYLVVSGKYSELELISTCLFGFLFFVIGNYLPKCKMNAIIGIKIPWTYSSENNWNKTHRLGGKVWTICGLLIMWTVFLPGYKGGMILISLFMIMILVPVVYSYLLFRKELKEGKASLATINDKMLYNKKNKKLTGAVLIAVFAFVIIFMFAGNIDFTCKEESLVIDATFWSDMDIAFDDIESVEYLEKDVKSTRINGYGSAQILMGTFKNKEFGYHTRYSYKNCDAGIMLDLGESIVIISADNEENTKKLYEKIVDKIK